jgi:DMSO/TMAO reductase YedYZ molybdopterin-dependent catalytic subunit
MASPLPSGHCVTRWSKLDTTWRGVRVRDHNDADPWQEQRHWF